MSSRTQAADERIVGIAAKIYEARGAMRGVLGEKYGKTVRPFRQLLRGQAKQDGKGLLPAALKLMQAFQDDGRDAVDLAMLLSAVADEMEAK